MVRNVGPHRTDVFVVGGGPAGLAAAIAVRRQGFRVILADSAESPPDKCCGEGLLPDGVAALRELGVAIPSSCARFHGIRFFDGGRTAEGSFAQGVGFGIRRTLLGQLLLARALEAGVECRYGARVTGIEDAVVHLVGDAVRARWIIGADGFRSQVRRWAGLDAGSPRTRYGFRRHFEMERPPDFVEVHWGDGFQAFVTPVSAQEVGVAMTTDHPQLRLERALGQLPELRRRLGPPVGSERGAITGSMALPMVYRGSVALVGDASGAVDSITGEGVRLAFRQSLELASAMARGDLEPYAAAHGNLASRPRMMADALLWLARHGASRRAAVRVLNWYPSVFRMLVSPRVSVGRPYAPATRKGVSQNTSSVCSQWLWRSRRSRFT